MCAYVSLQLPLVHNVPYNLRVVLYVAPGGGGGVAVRASFLGGRWSGSWRRVSRLNIEPAKSRIFGDGLKDSPGNGS